MATITKTSYSEKLRNPKWQKKRLEILNRDNFTCQECKRSDKTLHVHHVMYKQGCEPWEYDDINLITLCEYCHSYETDFSKKSEQELLDVLKSKGFLTTNIMDISSIFHSLDVSKYNRNEFTSALSYYLRQDGVIDKLVNDYKDEVING